MFVLLICMLIFINIQGGVKSKQIAITMSAKNWLCTHIHVFKRDMQADKEFIQEIIFDMKINIPLFNIKKMI